MEERMTSNVGRIVLIDSRVSGSEKALAILLGEDSSGYLIAAIGDPLETSGDRENSVTISQSDLVSGELSGAGSVCPRNAYWTRKEICKFVGEANSKFVDTLLRHQISFFIRTYYEYAHKPKNAVFKAGVSQVPVSGKVYGFPEIQALVESALDFWLTVGRFNSAFEKRFAAFLGTKHALTTNSGSSANLIALSALTSEKLGEKRLKPGDEVITVAAAFPTTVNPILQNRLIPVFLDISLPTYNIEADMLEKAISEKSRAILLAHTLGNPFDLQQVLRIAKKYDLWVIEDCCDALGSKFFLESSVPSLTHTKSNFVGSFGHMATFSFYPAHHITMGEGGALVTHSLQLKRILESFRDWGRDCFCAPGEDNTCGRRFEWQLGSLPMGYDHKYTYSHAGYNLKITEMQAAIGLAQMDRLERFIEIREQNFNLLKQGLSDLEDDLILPEPTPRSQPAWFGFPITIRETCKGNRRDLIRFLQQRNIGTRPLFAGNIIRQPYFDRERYRVVGVLKNTDFVMNNTFWIGIYPGISEMQIHYVIETIKSYFRQ